MIHHRFFLSPGAQEKERTARKSSRGLHRGLFGFGGGLAGWFSIPSMGLVSLPTCIIEHLPNVSYELLWIYHIYIYMPVSSSSSKWPFDSLNAGQQQALNRLLVGPNGMGFDTEFCVLEFEIGSSVLEDPAVGHNPGIIKWDLFWGGSKLMHNKWSIKQWPLVV